MKYFISDTHFYHENVIKFDQRPFSTIEEMNETLIQNWNEVVRPQDDVYILGDFCWKTASSDEYKQLVRRLQGRKTLIRGNHDPKNFSADVKKHFVAIHDYLEIKENGKQFFLCHYPMPMYKSSYCENNWMFYGHVHMLTKEAQYMHSLTNFLVSSHSNNTENLGHLVNVGCMMPYMNWRPQPWEYLIEVWQQTYGGNNAIN